MGIPLGGGGMGRGRAPERRGPLGRGEKHGHPLSSAPASAWWGLRCDYKNSSGLTVLKNREIQTKEGHKCYLLAPHSEKIIVNILV